MRSLSCTEWLDLLVAETDGQAISCQGPRAYDPGPLKLFFSSISPQTILSPALPSHHGILCCLVGAGCSPQGAHVGLG